MAGKIKGPLAPPTASTVQDRLMQNYSSFSLRYSDDRRAWSPPTDIYETEDAIFVKVEAAGMNEEDFTVTFTHDALHIAGVRHEPYEKVDYHQMEIRYGEFSTEVALHRPVRKEAIKASYAHGFLVIELPKSRAKKIVVSDGKSRS